MNEQDFCGEIARTDGNSASSLSIVGLLGAVAGVWALRFVMVALVGIAGGCAHTDIKRGPDDCGTFASSDHGFGLVVPTAGQYATYAQACGTERFSHIIAEQRLAVVAGAHAAAGGGRDELARGEILDVKHNVRELAKTVVQLGDVVGTGEGGAK